MAYDDVLAALQQSGVLGGPPVNSSGPASDDGVEALIRAISQGTPTVQPTKPKKLPTANRIALALADGMRAYGAARLGQSVPPSLLTEFRERRQRAADEETEHRQRGLDADTKAAQTRAALKLQRLEHSEERAERRSDITEQRSLEAQQAAGELSQKRMDEMRGLVREAGYFNIPSEGQTYESLQYQIGEAKRSLDDRVRAMEQSERSADAKVDKFAQEFDNDNVNRLLDTIEGNSKTGAPPLAAALEAEQDPTKLRKLIDNAKRTANALRKRTSASAAARQLNGIIEDELKPLLDEHEDRLEQMQQSKAASDTAANSAAPGPLGLLLESLMGQRNIRSNPNPRPEAPPLISPRQ